MPKFQNLAAAALLPGLYLVACALVAAAVAYPVFLWTGGSDISWFRTLVSRGGQVFLVLGLYPLWKVFAPPRGSFGIGPGFSRQLAAGFGLGVLMLGLHALLLVGLDIRVLKPEGWPAAGRLGRIVFNALLTGVLVALLEESIFRGALLGMLRKYVGAAAAVLVSSLYFGGLHFLGSRWQGEGLAVGFDTGFRIAADAFAHLARMDPDSFLGLFLAGLLLGSIRAVVPLGLGYCYGLHAGWVFVIKTAKALTMAVPDSPRAFLVGDYDRFVGYLSAAWTFVLIAALVLFFLRRGLEAGRSA